jgi:site-specific DNA-methyltransferase (adenine-specific)/modification methylase
VRVERIGDATLYLGDCLEILPTLGPVDAVVTDPPYGVAVDVEKLNRSSGPLQYWHTVEHAGTEWMTGIVALGVPTILFGANCYAAKLPSCQGWIVWDKQADGFAQGSPAELAWTNFLHNLKMFRLNYRGFTTDRDPKYHPMQKPLALMTWCIGFLPVVAHTVLDPFMGSGTTGVACANLGRKFIGIEIEPRYFDIACERIRRAYEQPRLPGLEPEKVKQGELL